MRIDAGKYPQFARDPAHPFASMSAEARIGEIDSFLALLRGRRRNKNTRGLSAAA